MKVFDVEFLVNEYFARKVAVVATDAAAASLLAVRGMNEAIDAGRRSTPDLYSVLHGSARKVSATDIKKVEVVREEVIC